MEPCCVSHAYTPKVQGGFSQSWGQASIRRRWLSQLLLVLYVAAVHGLPALHLGWHKSDHVHELGGLRWLTARLPAHAHAHATPHSAPEPVYQAQADRRTSQPRLRSEDGLSSAGFAPHLALGPSHGQQSLLAPLLFVSLAALRPTRPLIATLLVPSLRAVFTKFRARAPPASV